MKRSECRCPCHYHEASHVAPCCEPDEALGVNIQILRQYDLASSYLKPDSDGNIFFCVKCQKAFDETNAIRRIEDSVVYHRPCHLEAHLGSEDA